MSDNLKKWLDNIKLPEEEPKRYLFFYWWSVGSDIKYVDREAVKKLILAHARGNDDLEGMKIFDLELDREVEWEKHIELKELP